MNFFIYGKEVVNDSFSYIRGIVLIIIVSAGFVNLLLNKLISKEKYKWNIRLVGLSALFIQFTASYAFSDFREVAWMGGIDRYEGYYVLIAYIMLFLIALETKLKQNRLRQILLFL